LEVSLSGTVLGELDDGDPMDRGVELTIAVAHQARVADGGTGPVWDGGHPDIAGEGGLALEPLDPATSATRV